MRSDSRGVLVGLGRKLGEEPPVPLSCAAGVVDFACTQRCDIPDPRVHYRARWVNDPGLASCGRVAFLPRVETSNVICDPDFCSTAPGSTYEVSCCSPARVAYANGYYGAKRTPCIGTAACDGPASVIELSMVGGSGPHADPSYMTLHFNFDTTYPAADFQVRYRRTGTSPWTELPACSSPNSECLFTLCKHSERTTTWFECGRFSFQWQARVKNCQNADWTAYAPTTPKQFTSLCVQ